MKRLLVSILALFCLFPLIAQYQKIGGGDLNSFYQVETVNATYAQCPASTDLSTLHPGDKVVLIQMSGYTVDDYSASFVTSDLGLGVPGNVGNYEMLAVRTVNDGTDQVGFTVNLDPLKYTDGEKMQLVKIYEADYAQVTSELSVKAWDGSTGGVLAMVVFKKLLLNANIDASGKGFRGGEVVTDYTNGCRDLRDTVYFHQDVLNRAGNKGEGNVEASFVHTKGSGPIITGGGGGDGLYAGGGGGGHIGRGGVGGRQAIGCTNNITYTKGSLSLSNFYENGRITLGGGGGSSTEPDASNPATPGGNGGGIVIILADTLEANGNGIYSNGGSVLTTADAGAGGGGAGGAILLDINYYSDILESSVAGGKGGNTNDALDDATGAGGGGGGGIVMFADTVRPAIVTVDTSGGERGTAIISTRHGSDGNEGKTLPNLYLPLNGFLFNSLVGIDTICAGTAPDTIWASMPKGGKAAYEYNWFQSTTGSNWVPAVGTGDSLYFQPDELSATTYFTREVVSGDVKDTALAIKVFVYAAIGGNDLAIRDTLCYSSSTGELSIVGPITGGDGNYEYQWETYTDIAPDWDSIAATPSLSTTDLFVTTYYRRIVNSVMCADTSNSDTLTVFQLINNNLFPVAYRDTAICDELDAGTVRLDLPGGGEEGSYTLQWIESVDGINYTDIIGGNGQNYQPGIPDTSYYYKRVVISGSDSACIDTSNSFHLVVYDTIMNNLIQTDSSRYCWGDVPELILGNQPSGGDYSDYNYRWFTRLTNGDWELISGVAGRNYPPTTNYEDTVQLLRVVQSGQYAACIDSSNLIQIDVIPQIFNSLDGDDENICENQIPVPFNELAAGGGTRVLDYLWQYQLAGVGAWLPAEETPNDGISYAPGALDNSLNFRRAAISEICTTYSNTIAITVYPLIENNNILGAPIQYACYNSNKLLNATTIGGGKPSETPRYLWRQAATIGGWAEADGTITSKDFTSDPMTDSLYYHRIAYSGEADQCRDTSNVVLVRINSLPTGNIMPGIDTACSDKTIPVQYIELEGTSPWTIILGTSESDAFTTSAITDNAGQINYPVGNTGNVVLLDLIDDSTCHADQSLLTGVIDLKVYEYPEINAGADDQVCGTEYTLQATLNGESGYWLPNTYEFTDSTSPVSTVMVDEFSENIYHTFTWTDRNWICEVMDEVEIQFFEQPEQPDLGDDVELDNEFEYQLQAPNPIGQGSWIVQGPGDVLFADDDSTSYDAPVEFEYPITGDYLFIWTVDNGVCTSLSDSILVSIGEVELYDGFSPNGDGINDEYIVNLTGMVSATLTILDRWGNAVTVLTDKEQIKWDGTNSQGDDLTEGAYIYILEQEGINPRKGFIEIRR